MMKQLFILLFLLSVVPVFSRNMEDLLKDDFSLQQRLLIKNEVRKILGKESDSKKSLEMTKNIIPWAIMEGLSPEQIARMIVQFYQTDRAGIHFTENEDLIPGIAGKKISKRDFIYFSIYNKETIKAGIPERIRNVFLSRALDAGLDGMSVLAGGRGLIISAAAGKNLDATLKKLLASLPKKGFQDKTEQIKYAIEESSGKESVKTAESKEIIKNLQELQKHNTVTRPSSDSSHEEEVKITEKVGNKIDEIPIPEETISDVKEGKVLIVNILKSLVAGWIGTRYKWGGYDRSGIDCSGFTKKILTDKSIGINDLPHSANGQASLGNAVNPPFIRAGDLVFFSASPNRGKITHVGIAVSDTDFSHAASSGVRYDKLNAKYWSQRLVKSRRFFQKLQ